MKSTEPSPSIRRRAAVLVVVAAAVAMTCGVLAARLLPELLAPGADRTAGSWVVDAAGVVLAAGTSWLATLVLLAALALLRETPRTGATAPRRVRAAVLLVCGVGIALPTPAVAAERPGPAYGDRVATAVLLDGLRLPDRLAGPGAGPTRPHRVRAGDTLWDLARSTLPPWADATDVDRRWRAIHAANRAAVGSDPHLLRIGTRLTLPPPHPLGKARP